MKRALLLTLLAGAPAFAAPKPKPQTAEQKEADRHFKSGVALYSEQKFAEALAEFQRAYEIAPAPIVLLNIAACQRELSHYGEAIAAYKRFLDEGAGKAPRDKLAAAKADLDALLARIARVTVTTSPPGGAITVDGAPAGTEMPLLLAPGEHKLTAHLDGRKDADKPLRVASGDEVDVELKLAELPVATVTQIQAPPTRIAAPPPAAEKRIRLGAAFGTNLRDAGNTGAPDVGLGISLGRVELAIDATLVAYAVIPSIRVRLAGDQVSLHAIGAVPIAFADAGTFEAGAIGLGLRYRAAPAFSVRVEALASFATRSHGTTVPAFIGGELWF